MFKYFEHNLLTLNMISLETLQAIDSIDRKGSFSAAAEELFRVPSALTYTIKKTEEHLNIKLFDRSGQRAILTPAGKLVLERGRDILRQLKRLQEQAQEIENGCESQLRIVVDTILPLEPLWPLIKDLQDQHPWLNVQIQEEALSGSWEALVNDRADLMIGATGDEPAGGGWHKQSIGEISTQLYCSPDHPAAQLSQPINRSELQSFTHIVVNDSAHHLPARDIGLLGLQQALSVATMAHKLQALVAGMGISHLPYHLAKASLQQGLLQHLATDADTYSQTFFMAWPRENTGKLNQKLRQRIIEKDIFTRYLT